MSERGSPGAYNSLFLPNLPIVTILHTEAGITHLRAGISPPYRITVGFEQNLSGINTVLHPKRAEKDGINSSERLSTLGKTRLKREERCKTGRNQHPTVKRVNESGMWPYLPDYRGIRVRIKRELSPKRAEREA